MVCVDCSTLSHVCFTQTTETWCGGLQIPAAAGHDVCDFNDLQRRAQSPLATAEKEKEEQSKYKHIKNSL
jgi:hypothetical protein